MEVVDTELVALLLSARRSALPGTPAWPSASGSPTSLTRSRKPMPSLGTPSAAPVLARSSPASLALRFMPLRKSARPVAASARRPETSSPVVVARPAAGAEAPAVVAAAAVVATPKDDSFLAVSAAVSVTPATAGLRRPKALRAALRGSSCVPYGARQGQGAEGPVRRRLFRQRVVVAGAAAHADAPRGPLGRSAATVATAVAKSHARFDPPGGRSAHWAPPCSPIGAGAARVAQARGQQLGAGLKRPRGEEPVDEPPAPRRALPYPASAGIEAFRKRAIRLQLDIENVRVMTDPAVRARVKVLSPAFVVRLSSGDARVVIDYRYSNSYMAQRACRYETLADMAQVLWPEDALLVWDVADADHHLFLLPEDALYLALEPDGPVFIPLTMPFGLREAPFPWSKVCRAVVQALRGNGFRKIFYVDDFGEAHRAGPGQSATQTEGILAFYTVQSLLMRLGLRVDPRKGVRTGPTAFRLLGHTGDTERRLLLLPPDRALSTEQTAAALYRWATAHRRNVKFSQLRAFLGMAVSTHLSVPTARFHLAALYAAPNARRTGDVLLNHQVWRELPWWSALRRHSSTERAIFPAPHTVMMETDASTGGWGAPFDGATPARGFHGPHRRSMHIIPLELCAVRLELQSFSHLLADRETVIRMNMDPTVAIGAINHGTSSSPAMIDA